MSYRLGQFRGMSKSRRRQVSLSVGIASSRWTNGRIFAGWGSAPNRRATWPRRGGPAGGASAAALWCSGGKTRPPTHKPDIVCRAPRDGSDLEQTAGQKTSRHRWVSLSSLALPQTNVHSSQLIIYFLAFYTRFGCQCVGSRLKTVYVCIIYLFTVFLNFSIVFDILK